MSTYKLYYFPLRAKAEAIRLALHFKGVPFEDVKIARDDWINQKSKFVFGQVPVLEVDGKQIAHSWAILRHLGRKFDLAGKDEDERVVIDQVSELWRDYVDATSPYIGVSSGFQEGDREKLRNEKLLPSLERFGPHFQRILKESGSGFFGKSGVSYVDFFVAEGLYSLYNVEKEFLETKYPFLVEYFKRVHGLPELQKYLSTRQHTPI